MDVIEASKIIIDASSNKHSSGTTITGLEAGSAHSSIHNYGKYYGKEIATFPLGVGQIYTGIRYPIINAEELVYDTVEGMVYVLTHECDVDQDNNRPFNDVALICPIIPLDVYLTHLQEQVTDDLLINDSLCQLGKDNIHRLLYFPPIYPELEYGGVINLNQITHTHISSFESANCKYITSLSADGLRVTDYKIKNHLLRPKDAPSPLSRN